MGSTRKIGIIGVPKEIKDNEYRVGMVPASVNELTSKGLQVIVETNAGGGIGFTDGDYEAVGAKIVPTLEDVYNRADMIVKVKEPQERECRLLQEGQVLFTYLHLAPDPLQAELLLASKCTAIAYETVTNAQGGLPLLAPMSEVAGRLSIQAGAHCLEKINGGSGVLLGGVPGVLPGKVAIIGGGVVGVNAAIMAIGLGADVTVLDKSLPRLRELNVQFGNKLHTLFATTHAIEEEILQADLVVGAVLVPGAQAPKLISRQLVAAMKHGSVLVDVSIDQGGCAETSKITTYSAPTFVVDGVVHYCVANMPGAVARTSAFALNNATLPFILALSGKGYKQALIDDPHLMNGLNVHNGKITHKAVAEALGYTYTPGQQALG